MCYPVVNLSLNNQAYRVRFVETELPKDKRMSISEFSYNPNVKNIRMMRLNLPGEQVLYTSTNPRTSYEETISSKDKTKPFYLSVWSKKNVKQTCTCFLSSFDSCSDHSQSNAFKIKTEFRNKLTTEQELAVVKIGKKLEKNASQGNNTYEESSQLASNIFNYADCIITPSAKDSKEVNLTFNKDFADKSLILNRIYFCSPFPCNKRSLLFRVNKIGLVINNRVEWYNWKVKNDILKDTNSNLSIKYNDSDQIFIFPNVNKPIDDWHIGFYKQKKVKFQIEIEEDNNLHLDKK